MKRLTQLLLGIGCVAITASSVFAQAFGSATPAKNLIPNGDFKEKSRKIDNNWDGVDAGGFLNAKIGDATVPLLQLSGAFNFTAVPVSVNAVDMNGDGMLDLLVGTNSGYILCYFNSGSKTEPKFTSAELLPLNVARGFFSDGPNPNRDKTTLWRNGCRINFFDWSRTGKLDLLVGNYRGELLFIPNRGSALNPEYKQVAMDQANVLAGNWWGNLFAPVAYDFDHDGRVDVAFGEGGYSANSIHLCLNKGSNSNPKFEEGSRQYLAYGEGNEQLVPALADYNGDGFMDLLVGDREGHVAIYLNPGQNWKPGKEFSRSGYIKFGGVDKLGEAVAPYTADMNGDGLFDLLLGKANGHIALAINKGTKTEPKFERPVDIKGTDLVTKPCVIPELGEIANPTDNPQVNKYRMGWYMDFAVRRGNSYGYYSLVTGTDEDPKADIPADRPVLKAGYSPVPSKIFKTVIPIWGGKDEKNYLSWKDDFWYGSQPSPLESAWVYPSDVFTAGCIIAENALSTGKSYRISFRVKGANLARSQWRVGFFGVNKHDVKTVRGERGSVSYQPVDLKQESVVEEGNLPVTANWTEVGKTFTVRFSKVPELNRPDKVERITALFEIRAALKPYDGLIYIDNVRLVETR